MVPHAQSTKTAALKVPLRIACALAVAFLGAFALFHLIQDGFYPLASIVGAATIFLVLIIIRPSLSSWRWLATGIILAVLFTVFPILYTVYLSFTNMSGGHLLTKQQAISRLLEERYAPDDAAYFSWTAYADEQGHYRLLLDDGAGKRQTVRPGAAPQDYSGSGDAPDTLDGLPKLDAIQTMQRLQELTDLRFGVAPDFIAIQAMDSATTLKPRYVYDASQDSMTDLSTNLVYRPKNGTFSSDSGNTLIPGFIVSAGLDNYTRFLGNDGYRKPILEIIIWNLAFSLLSVGFSFILGLTIAVLFEKLPGKRIIRSLLIIPYPIPVLVAIMVWRALLNERMGLVTTFLANLFGSSPAFFTDVGWTRFAVILINIYLSYPYFYILCTGALRSIPSDLYEAAEIDGAKPWQALRFITMPMLLRILMPLLIASFSFNFNNFTIIWGFNAGLPAMADTIVPMGHSDLLISFIYRLGFSTANAADYGFSAAITVILFIFVGLMVFLQTRNTKVIKEVD